LAVCVSSTAPLPEQIRCGSQLIALQNAVTKLQPEKMWSADSSAPPQMAKVAPCSMFLVTRAVLHCILFLVRSQTKNFTRGGTKVRQTN
jgi:hypothetical protein